MKKFIIFTDGGSRGNPGRAAAGFVFCNEMGQPLKKYGDFLGEEMTNNEAEYMALVLALKKFKAVFGKALAQTAEIEVRSDSELIVKQLNGQYRIAEPRMQQFFMEIWNLKFDFKTIKFKNIPREQNKEADQLVNEALDSRQSPKGLF